MENETMRVNIRMPLELKEWFEAEAKKFGCPYSALMSIALKEYQQQRKGLQDMNNFASMADDIRSLTEVIQELKKEAK